MHRRRVRHLADMSMTFKNIYCPFGIATYAGLWNQTFNKKMNRIAKHHLTLSRLYRALMPFGDAKDNRQANHTHRGTSI